MSDYHTCTFYCQDGLHAYECLVPLTDTAAEVLEAARLWVAHLGWSDEVVHVQPARESDAAQILQPSMIEVDDDMQTVRDVTPDWVDLSRYRPWLVFLRPRAAAGEGEQ